MGSGLAGEHTTKTTSFHKDRRKALVSGWVGTKTGVKAKAVLSCISLFSISWI